ncbi:hypothetical protein LJB76_02760 [Clostridia bacterium OttesenSCG-928-O13]|nr:hypothetical protein [Clostridia bacterium OttesenSCG-928-O13]
MDKFISILLCTMMLFALAACGGKAQSEASKPVSEPAPSSATTLQPEPTPKPESEPESVSESQLETEMESVTFRDVTFSYPAGAEVEEDDEGVGIVLEFKVATLTIQANPDMTSEVIDAMLGSDEAWEASAKLMAESGGELEESAIVDFAGGRAGYMRVTDQMDDVVATMEAYVFSAGGNLYILGTMLTSGGEEKYGDVMRQMMDSVEVNW